MNEIVIALIGLSGTILLTLIGIYGARKYNIGPNQERLVSTLKDLVNAQQSRIEQLEADAEENRRHIAELRKDYLELKELTVEQALTISYLESELEKARKGV